MKTQRSLCIIKPDYRRGSPTPGKEADTNIDRHPGKLQAKWSELDLMPFPCLAPSLIPSCPEPNESLLFLRHHQEALLLVSHCSCPGTSSIAPGNLANALSHPDLHTELSAASAAPFGQLVHGSPFPLALDPIQAEDPEASVPLRTLHLDPPSRY